MLNWRDPRNPLAGGAERVTMGYMSALAQRGHTVFWFAYEFPGGKREEVLDGVHVIRGGGMGTSILHAWRWYQKQTPFDLVIDQHHGIPWFAPWWCKTRVVSYIHEVLGPIWDAFYSWPLSTVGKFQERWTHWLYRHIPFWTACQSTCDSLRENGVKNITIIPYGVHTVALPELPEKPLKEPLKLVVVSRLAPNKRVDHAIRAVHSLVGQKVESHLTIIGAGGIEPQLKTLTQALGLQDKVHFAGLLSEKDKDNYLRESHFLLHTSQREGWGLNVIEANAMGTPAVVYPVKGLVESTLHEQTGLVSDLETPESLASSIVQSLKDDHRYQYFRQQAWERAKTFHWSVVLPQACAWLENQARS